MATTQVLPPLPVKQLLRKQHIEALTGDSRSTIYRKIKRGLFPKPIASGRDKNGQPTTSVWQASEVAAVNAARIAGKSDDEIRQLVAELEAARLEAGK